MSQSEYAEAFKTAEQHLKFAENIIHIADTTGNAEFVSGLLFPAVNELRYSSRHAIQATESCGENDREDAWKKARDHCFRASYDAFDAQLQYIISECAIFQNDFRRGVEISQVISEYQEDCRILNKIKKVNYRQTGKREDHWEDMKKHVDILLPILEKWNTARDELNKILRKELLDRWFKTLGIFGGIAAVIALILKLF